jgi:hypothetical protein
MGPLDSERETRDTAPLPRHPINLTAASEPMSWPQACEMIGVAGPSEGPGLEVHGIICAENGYLNDSTFDVVYVVVSGFGVLHSHDTDVDCTAGDVLFVPRGCPHRFKRLDRDMKIWRVSLIAK